MLHSMEALSLPAREYLSSVRGKPECVRRFVATGSTNAVFEYDDPKKNRLRFLKIPLAAIKNTIQQKIYDIFTKQELADAKRELELCYSYFEPFMVPTDMETSADGKNFVFIQDPVDFENIDAQMVRSDSGVREQLEDITAMNGKLEQKEKLWLDMMGMNAWKLPGLLVGRPYFDNVVLERLTRQVKIIDYGLFTPKLKHRIQYAIQHYNARLYGLSFTGKK